MDAVDENRNRKRVNDLEVLESLHVGERFPQDRGVCPKRPSPPALSRSNLSRKQLPLRFVHITRPRVTDRGQPCLREEVEVVSRPKDIQWTRWTRIETGNELMT
ncbi:hypothetical protein CEXT_237691 [Caerostris extrusa]|uniref:Uncharacterized protein n=1 Tax=Caerostris extrusa TaxID=172846 RepID=A0AAV4WWE4_CAEEX|nr:hypothetical protein CEXT_237691 [Caerostris extrusa]